MKQQPMGPILGPWFKGMDETPPDAQECAREVMARLPEIRQRRGWWPLPALDRPVSTFPSRELAPAPIPATNGPTPVRGFSMFSLVKLVVAAAIMALFGGFLLVSDLSTPDGDPMAPGAATESSSPTTAAESPSGMDTFPSGTFVSVENNYLMLELGGDGTGVKHDLTGSTTPFTYAVDDGVYTWLTSENGNERNGQPTYAWDYDGTRLAFELLGEDPFTYRKWVYTENTFELAEDPQVVVVAERDLDVGKSVRPIRGYVPAAEVDPDAYISMMDVVGYVAAVPISKGQPITPDLLEPAE